MYEQELPGQKSRYIVELTNEDEKFCKNVYDKFNVGGELFSNYEDKINFILCMLVMPQLLAIGEFYERAYNEHTTKAKSILSVVQNNNINMHNINIVLDQDWQLIFLIRKYIINMEK